MSLGGRAICHEAHGSLGIAPTRGLVFLETSGGGNQPTNWHAGSRLLEEPHYCGPPRITS